MQEEHAAGRRPQGTAAGPTQDTQEQVVIEETLLEAEEKMEKAVVVAKEDFAAIRTGRAHPAMFNKIVADYYGAATPINQLASFSWRGRRATSRTLKLGTYATRSVRRRRAGSRVKSRANAVSASSWASGPPTQ
ncbi:Ribosome-recycling factor [Streptomyces tendae]